MVTTKTMLVHEEAASFNKAWNHPDETSQKKEEAICKEFANMNKQQVWHKTTKSLMPHNWHCVESKWVFKIKCNGMYPACLVACGYSQVTGINFSKNYSPVANDITFHILLLMFLHFWYAAKIVDIDMAFLYEDLEEEIYMECPQGMANVKKDDCIILKKCIYGFIQAAWQYYKKAMEILKNWGFEGGSIDPCLYAKRSAKGIVYIALYIDDNLMIGNKARIDDTI